jgi:hypothetical protein
MGRSGQNGRVPSVKQRLFAYALLLAVVLPPVTGTSHWPFTTLKLFSQVRQPVQWGWDVTMTTADGVTSPVPWTRLPRSFHFHNHVLRRFPSMTASQRQQSCDAWADAVRAVGPDPVRLQVFRIQRRVPTDGKAPGPLVRRDLRFQCQVGR